MRDRWVRFRVFDEVEFVDELAFEVAVELCLNGSFVDRGQFGDFDRESLLGYLDVDRTCSEGCKSGTVRVHGIGERVA